MRGRLSIRPDLLRATNDKHRWSCRGGRDRGTIREEFFSSRLRGGPSGSCVHQVRAHLTAIEQTDEVKAVRERTFELTEFLHDILQVEDFPWAEFPHKVGIHYNCNSLRGLGLASASELHRPSYSKPRDLLAKVKGVQFVDPARPDECCGFGGTFCVFEPTVSAKMGYDKVTDHARAGAEYIVSADSSCMMHQKGCAERIGVPIKFMHIARILNGAAA